MRIPALFFHLAFFLLCLPTPSLAGDFPLTFTDSRGQQITLQSPPRRILSLVPSITDILLRLGAGDSVVGITTHVATPHGSSEKAIVGGFLDPDQQRIRDLSPDILFYSDLQHKILPTLPNDTVAIHLAPRSIAEGFSQIRLLGTILQQHDKAEKLIAEQQRQLALISAKTAKIPAAEKQRAIRLMASEPFMVPGDDSFQNEYIRAAGAIAPEFGRNGQVIPISLAEWQEFDPQIIYACGRPETASKLQQPGWREVAAVRNKRIFFFPCELTCRLGGDAGFFTSWLAATIYGEAFSKREQLVEKEEIIGCSSLSLDLPYVRKAEIITSTINDFRNKTLLLTLNEPMAVVSSLEGRRGGINNVANHFYPPPAWGLGQSHSLTGLRESSLPVLGLEAETTAMLFTGADTDNLSITKKSFREMEVVALVTAGVAGNAMRMGSDSGNFYEPEGRTAEGKKPGTINILLLTNMQLSPHAMTRALITATEGKSAALQDLDIRSSFSGAVHAATGTGTDNIIVVEGRGMAVDGAGGHTKMGELIARAVYDGVREAVSRQNGLTEKRSIFRQLEERRIDLGAICKNNKSLQSQVEHLLLLPANAAFMRAALVISDDYQRGLLTDLTAFDDWCRVMAATIHGGPISLPETVNNDIPLVIGKALAVFTGNIQPTEHAAGSTKDIKL